MSTIEDEPAVLLFAGSEAVLGRCPGAACEGEDEGEDEGECSCVCLCVGERCDGACVTCMRNSSMSHVIR